MIFTSLAFLLFFTAFFGLYWFVFGRHYKLQNVLLLAGSYFFYAWADWRFLAYLVVISGINYVLGTSIEKSQGSRRRWLLNGGLIVNIGGLAYFKYYNFFVSSLHDAFSAVGFDIGLRTLQIIAPIGISFFTFRLISYLLDVDKEKTQATHDPIVFFNYVSFFPSILSGPIDKAKMFIPQLEKPRLFESLKASDAMRQILWGLFKKVVIANNCSAITDEIYRNYETLPASSLFIGCFLYAIQIYADFSGYSDMAIGIARLLGFNITKNFDFPFFSQNIAEYWRKWHISLTAWLTEYVFTPLSIAFRDYGDKGLMAAVIVNFTIIGIWHGPNWTYVLFGFLHGCYYIPLILNGSMNKKKKIAKGKNLPTFGEIKNVVLTFLLVMLTLVLFKSESITKAFDFYGHLVSLSLFSWPVLDFATTAVCFAFTALMFVVEWFNREKEHGLEISAKPKTLRWSVYFGLVIIMLFFGVFAETQFIYFQF